jgi:hypothetical protein
MTMVHERNRSLIQTWEFLRELSQDMELPESIRSQAKVLLRHYPTAKDISLASRLRQHRKKELAFLADERGPLPPVLASWLMDDSVFSDE